MKLFSPGACSLSPHLVPREAGLAFAVTTWTGHVKVDLEPFPALGACQARVAARPAVQEAMQAEGLLQQ